MKRGAERKGVAARRPACKLGAVTSPRRYPLIFNPQARSRRARRALAFLMKHAGELALYATNHPGEARELAARFAAAGEPAVIAAGGDGTVNEVAQGLAGGTCALGVLPVGTMNVFARELGFPLNDLERCFQLIKTGRTVEIDLFQANGSPFVQMAGVGIDAKIIEDTSWQSKKALGPLAYVLTAVRVLGKRPPLLEVLCDDGRREKGVAVLMGNGALYGGGFRVFPEADNRDGLLDALVFKEAGFRMALDSFRGITNGGFASVENTAILRAPAFTVKARIPVPVEVDGELLGSFERTRFSLAKTRLRVICPDPEAAARGAARENAEDHGKPRATEAAGPLPA